MIFAEIQLQQFRRIVGEWQHALDTVNQIALIHFGFEWRIRWYNRIILWIVFGYQSEGHRVTVVRYLALVFVKAQVNVSIGQRVGHNLCRFGWDGCFYLAVVLVFVPSIKTVAYQRVAVARYDVERIVFGNGAHVYTTHGGSQVLGANTPQATLNGIGYSLAVELEWFGG